MPDELLLAIFAHVDGNTTFASLPGVCRRWRALSAERVRLGRLKLGVGAFVNDREVDWASLFTRFRCVEELTVCGLLHGGGEPYHDDDGLQQTVRSSALDAVAGGLYGLEERIEHCLSAAVSPEVGLKRLSVWTHFNHTAVLAGRCGHLEGLALATDTLFTRGPEMENMDDQDESKNGHFEDYHA
jgi:hypothetical protein